MGLLFVNVWRGMCLLLAVFSGNVAVAQEITLTSDPASQPVPCPNQTLVYNCTVDGYGRLVWTLPTSGMTDELVFTAVEGVGTNRSNGQFNATLINNELITGSMPTVNLMTSTLVISPPLDEFNGLALICTGRGSEMDMDEMNMTNVTVSGIPDPPQQLEHNVSANTESSAVIQWQSPNNTGGNNISIINYIMVTDNGQTASVSGDVFTYNITGLDFNNDHTIQVTAVNSCGLESEPANVTVNIEARVPPTPDLLPTELHCDVPLTDGRPVVINWMYGNETQDEGVVYPGEVEVGVNLDPGDINCSSVTADNISCTVNITRDEDYTVSLTLSNDVSSTQLVESMFNSKPLVTNDTETDRSLRVCFRVQPLCRIASYTIIVFFGVQTIGGNYCDFSDNVNRTSSDVMPGESQCLEVNSADLELSTGEEYCYNVFLIGDARLPDVDTGSVGGLSVGAIVGISVAAFVIVVILMAIFITYCKLCRHPKNTDQGSEQVDLRKSGQASPEVQEYPPATTEMGVTYQDPTTITRTPHPTTGEVYTDVKLDKKKREKVEVGPMYQDPSAIEHQQAASGDTYALPQKGKKGKKGEKGNVGEGEREEEKAGLYSTPDRKGQKAKSDGLTYARLDMQATSKKAPPPAGSMYVDLQHPN